MNKANVIVRRLNRGWSVGLATVMVAKCFSKSHQTSAGSVYAVTAMLSMPHHHLLPPRHPLWDSGMLHRSIGFRWLGTGIFLCHQRYLLAIVHTLERQLQH